MHSHFLHLEPLSKQPTSSRRVTYTTQTSKVPQLYGFPEPLEVGILRRHIWEAICHRLRVPILRMLHETEAVHEKVLEVPYKPR
jgi:hypothetical protein